MRDPLSKTLAVVFAVGLGLAVQAAAQTSTEAQRARQRTPASTQKPKTQPGGVKVTEAPAEAAPAATAAAPAPGGQVREETAISGARDWLALVDAGNYGASYDQAGEVFRGTMAREQWDAALTRSRKPLGNVGERNLKTAVVAQNLPNAPAGKYVITTFESTFSQQTGKKMWEVLTSFLGPNGWQVVGYQVKPEEAAAQGQSGQAQQQQGQKPPR